MNTFNPISALSKNMCMEFELHKDGIEAIKRMLDDSGYFNMHLDNTTNQCIHSALLQGAVIISKSTGGILIRKNSREAPAYVDQGSIKIGDNVQLLNWKPLGVRGATIDLFPKGKVTKTYFRKCLVKSGDVEEYQDRLEGIELDGKGPEDIVFKSGKKLPYILKDSTIILRYPEMATPDGNTDHHSLEVM